jgi:hypothetical protein
VERRRSKTPGLSDKEHEAIAKNSKRSTQQWKNKPEKKKQQT